MTARKNSKSRDLDACYAEATKFDAKKFDQWVRKNFEIFCKRTDYPKLGYIISRLNALGIPCLLHGESFHAENILWVSKEGKNYEKAYKIFNEKCVGKRLDDIPDDHWFFDPYASVKPEPLIDITGNPAWDRTVAGDR